MQVKLSCFLCVRFIFAHKTSSWFLIVSISIYINWLPCKCWSFLVYSDSILPMHKHLYWEGANCKIRMGRPPPRAHPLSSDLTGCLGSRHPKSHTWGIATLCVLGWMKNLPQIRFVNFIVSVDLLLHIEFKMEAWGWKVLWDSLGLVKFTTVFKASRGTGKCISKFIQFSVFNVEI